jgi:hypothetical protein
VAGRYRCPTLESGHWGPVAAVGEVMLTAVVVE